MARGGDTWDLARLLHPLPVEVFSDEVWGTTHYHVQRDCAGYFDSLLAGSSAAEELLEQMRPAPAAVRLVRLPHATGSKGVPPPLRIAPVE